MLSPTPRLLWIVLLLVVPVMAIAGVNTALLIPAALLILLLAAALAADAYRLSQAMGAIQVTAASPVSAYKDRSESLNISADFPDTVRDMAVALDLPATFTPDEISSTIAPNTPVPINFTPQTRGEFHIHTAFFSGRSSSGMWRLRSQKPLSLMVKVFPDLSKDPSARKLFFSLQQGQRVQRVVGRGREVERLREYASGDSFDEIYWKATARRGAPVSKVFQVERTQDIYAIVDGSRYGNRNQALERFVTASLLLAVATEKNADNFGLLTYTDKVNSFVRASHGKGHFHHCREAIFDLQPNAVSPDFGEVFTFINLRIRKRALLFFLTDLSDPLLAETFLRDASIVTRRHVVMVDQIADAGDRPLFTGPLPETSHDIQSRLAGHLQWAKLRELEKSLQRIGVKMQLLKPEHATTELIGQYRSVKQRQLL